MTTSLRSAVTSTPDGRAPAFDARCRAERTGNRGSGAAAGGNPTPGADGRAALCRLRVGLTAGRRHLGGTSSAGPHAAAPGPATAPPAAPYSTVAPLAVVAVACFAPPP